MAASAIWRWVVVHLARQPLVLVLWGLALVSMPLVQRMQPLSSLGSLEVETVLAWSFPAGLIGVLLGLATLSHHDEFLRRLDPGVRSIGDLGATLAPALLLQLPISLGALAGGTPAAAFAARVPAILCADLRLAGLALLMLVPGITTAARVLGFLALAWIGPALVRGGRTGALAQLLDASAALHGNGGVALVAALLPGVAFVLAAHLLRLAGRHATAG